LTWSRPSFHQEPRTLFQWLASARTLGRRVNFLEVYFLFIPFGLSVIGERASLSVHRPSSQSLFESHSRIAVALCYYPVLTWFRPSSPQDTARVLLNGSVDNINTFKVLGAFKFPLGGLDRCLGAILSKIPKDPKRQNFLKYGLVGWSRLLTLRTPFLLVEGSFRRATIGQTRVWCPYRYQSNSQNFFKLLLSFPSVDAPRAIGGERVSRSNHILRGSLRATRHQQHTAPFLFFFLQNLSPCTQRL